MADVATPSGAAMFDAGNTEKKEKTGKPAAPDEAAYKAALAKAQKEHDVAMDKFVCNNLPLCSYLLYRAIVNGLPIY
jgi:hypothetical protein